MTTDSKGNIWLIDDGKRAGTDSIPEGAAKVVGFTSDGNVLASVPISSPVLRQDMHLNNLRIDLKHGKKGMAYITNSSFGTTPSLVVVDIATGQAREVIIPLPFRKDTSLFWRVRQEHTTRTTLPCHREVPTALLL